MKIIEKTTKDDPNNIYFRGLYGPKKPYLGINFSLLVTIATHPKTTPI